MLRPGTQITHHGPIIIYIVENEARTTKKLNEIYTYINIYIYRQEKTTAEKKNTKINQLLQPKGEVQ